MKKYFLVSGMLFALMLISSCTTLLPAFQAADQSLTNNNVKFTYLGHVQMKINSENLKNVGIRASLLELAKATYPDATDVVDIVVYLRHNWMRWTKQQVARVYVAEGRVIKTE